MTHFKNEETQTDYENFCERFELDPTISPDSQFDLSPAAERLLNRFISHQRAERIEAAAALKTATGTKPFSPSPEKVKGGGTSLLDCVLDMDDAHYYNEDIDRAQYIQ